VNDLTGNEKIFKILLIEDNVADIRLIMEALKSFKTKKDIYHVKDGIEAICFLKQQEQYKDSPRPDIVILDLNLPIKNGFEVLKEIKEDKNIKNVPVVVLSTSNLQDDINKSYLLQASCYITKPIELDDFIKALKKIEDFWLDTVKLPD